jgi:PRTRC genetic system protein F
MSINQGLVARDASPGSFLIPAIDPAIPPVMSQDVTRSRTLARLAKAAAAEGIPMPSGEFLRIEEVVQAQWTQYLARFPDGVFEGVRGSPAISVTDTSLSVVIGARTSLNVYQLKPVVEQLEAALPGLGWFVQGAMQEANYHGHEQYEMSRATYILDGLHWDLDEFTDQAYARRLLEDQGVEPPDGEIPPDTMESLRADYSFWPSEILDEVEGHEHLLGMGGTKPKRLKPAAAEKWLRQNAGHALAEAVRLSLDLIKACDADRERKFVWNGQEDDLDSLGALCFVCWDNPNLLIEAISHYEQNQYNGGQCVEAFARHMLDLTAPVTDTHLRGFVRAAADYFNRWALLGKLLSHFPTWEDDDET